MLDVEELVSILCPGQPGTAVMEAMKRFDSGTGTLKCVPSLIWLHQFIRVCAGSPSLCAW